MIAPRTTPRKVMILTADAGFGHRSAANAVNEALKDLYGESVNVRISNPLEDERAPVLLRDSQYDYDKWIKNAPELYHLGYSASDALIPTRILERTLAVLLFEVMKEELSGFKPDVILSTYPMYQSAVTTLFRAKRCRIPFLTVVTDLSTVHRLWFHKKVDSLLVPNQIVADLARSDGIPQEKIRITGIPVHPAIQNEKRSKTEIRNSIGWEIDIPAILAVGSKRVENLIPALNVVNHSGHRYQLAVVAGNDEELYQELKETKWHLPVHLYNFVENMPELMKASDLIISKAGGLIVTESMACGLPMILIELIPGQETGNAEYVTSAGAADVVTTPVEMMEVLCHLTVENGALLKTRSQNARLIGRPDSAYAVAKILWEMMDTWKPPRSKRKKSLSIGKGDPNQLCNTPG